MELVVGVAGGVDTYHGHNFDLTLTTGPRWCIVACFTWPLSASTPAQSSCATPLADHSGAAAVEAVQQQQGRQLRTL
jgi:hypothetical protein